jgi:hypothetical protein
VHEESAFSPARSTLARQKNKQKPVDILLPEPLMEWADSTNVGPVVVLRSRHLGDQTIQDELGVSLMAAFLRTIAGSPTAPRALLLYGSAVVLVLGDSPYLDLFRRLEQNGSEILCCQISFAAFTDEEAPAVGRLADWVDLTDRMEKAHHVLWP